MGSRANKGTDYGIYVKEPGEKHQEVVGEMWLARLMIEYIENNTAFYPNIVWGIMCLRIGSENTIALSGSIISDNYWVIFEISTY